MTASTNDVLIRIGALLDHCDRLGVEVLTDHAYRVTLPVAGLRALFNIAADNGSDIDDLDLPIRAHNALRAAGIRTVAQLTARSPGELLPLRGVGVGSVTDIQNALAAHGLKLKDGDD